MDFEVSKLHRTEDGWITEDSRAFRVLTEHDPIRPWGWRDQIRVDCRSHLVPWIWVRGVLQTVVCSLVIAFVLSIDVLWGLVLVPLLWLAIKPLKAWRTLASNMIDNIRTKPVSCGLVKGWKPHPIFFFLHIGEVKLADGKSVLVSISSDFLQTVRDDRRHCREPSTPIVENGDQTFEVLMMYDPSWTCQIGFAVREA